MKNLFLLILLLAVAGCNTDLNVGQEDEALALRGEKQMVPFHSEVNQWFDLTGGFMDCGIPGTQIPIRWGFEGESTHIGHGTGWGEGYQCFISPQGIFHGDYTGSYVAANGDELWFDGSVEFNLPTGEFLSNEGEFTGGTGRWVNATGWFTSTAEPTETPGVTFYIHDGEVSAPGKK